MSGSTVENRRKPSSTGKTCGFNICVYVCVCVRACVHACVCLTQMSKLQFN